VFYFQHLLNTAMGGIDATSIIPTITNIAFAILLVGFLLGLYQAALRGGDLQALAVTAIKYLVIAMIIANWASIFRDVNGSCNAVANFIGSSSGAGDMFLNWMTQLQQQATTNPGLTFWDLINGDPAGTITVLLLLVAYVVYALAIIIFCFFYTLFGSVLYVLGPLVLALIPVSGIGQLGKTYAVNLMIGKLQVGGRTTLAHKDLAESTSAGRFALVRTLQTLPNEQGGRRSCSQIFRLAASS
jgi:hypothetical protein